MEPTADRAYRALTEDFVRLYPGEAAGKIESLPARETARLLETLPPPERAAILERLTPAVAARALERMGSEPARQVLPVLDPGRAAALLAQLDEDVRRERLDALDPAIARELRELMSYPEDRAGHLMDVRVAAFREETTARETLGRLRERRERLLHDVLVVDDLGRLTGAVALQDLALAPPAERLGALVRRDPLHVQAMASREEVVELMENRRLTHVPVVDLDGRLLGVIRHGALVAAARDEASADIQTMVGVSKEERALSTVPFAIRKRLPWLEINLGTAFLAAAVVGLFEGTIARFTALAVLLPVVAGQSGNTGAQALAVTMRGLALREVRPRHWFRLALKEMNVAMFNGIAVALTTALGVYVWSRSFGLSLVIALSMVISMMAAGVSGASIPIVLIMLRQDPAQASSIILTTVTDVVGFLSFLGIATLLAATL